MAGKKQKKICIVCGGTGQIGYFKGVSRFLLSNEECEECAGTGIALKVAEDLKQGDPGKKSNKKK